MDRAAQQPVAIRAVFAFVSRYWARMPVAACVMVVGSLIAIALEVYIPTASADLVLAVQQYMAEGEADAAGVARAAVWLLLGVFALRALIMHLYLRVWMHIASATMHRMVTESFARVQRFSTDWHANNFAGSTVRMMTRGMWAYDSFADTVVMDLGPAFILLFGFALAMYLRDPLLGLYFATTVTVFLTITISLSLRYVAPANRESNAADTSLGGALADAVTCNTVIKTFGAEVREDARLHGTSDAWRVRARRAWLRSMNLGGLQSVLIIAMLGGMFFIVLRRAGEPGANVDDIVYVVTTYFIVNGYLRNIGWQIRNLQRSINELDDLVRIESTLPQVADAPDAKPFEPQRCAIEFDHVSFRYANQPDAVYQGLNVNIEAGERVALVGESGAGKTTFVKLLQRLYDLDGGRILIDGQDIAAVQQESLRAAIALVPQEPLLFHRTLAENIAYGRPGASHTDVERAARQAHAHDFIMRLEDGYATLVGERGVKLSGGERQRVAIARAILADAPLLILDEATSSLDSETELQIQAAIATLMEGRTAIVVAHRLSTIRAADRILVFEAGRITEQGSHDQLMALPDGRYRRLFDIQSLGFQPATAD